MTLHTTGIVAFVAATTCLTRTGSLPSSAGTEIESTSNVMRPSLDKMIVTQPAEPIAGTRKGLRLRGREVFETPGSKMITEYDLTRTR